jgi:hypothetical protein
VPYFAFTYLAPLTLNSWAQVVLWPEPPKQLGLLVQLLCPTTMQCL